MNDQFGNRRNGNDKRFDRYRRYGEQSNFRFPSDNAHEAGKRKKNDKQLLAENLQSIRKSLELISSTLSRLVEVIDRRVEAEERQVTTIENLQTHMETLVQGPGRVGEEGNGLEPAGMADLAPEDETAALADAADGPAADRGELLARIGDLREQGLSLEKIAQTLETEGIPTISGRGKWRGQSVQRVLRQMEG